MFGSLKISLVFIAIIAVLLGGFYWFYRDTNARIAILIQNNAQLQTAVSLNEQTIQTMKDNYAKQTEVLSDTLSKFEAARVANQKLAEKIRNRPIGKDGVGNPGVVESIINNAARESNRCFEILSGSPLTEQEKNATKKSEINNECPEIANPSYHPN